MDACHFANPPSQRETKGATTIVVDCVLLRKGHPAYAHHFVSSSLPSPPLHSPVGDPFRDNSGGHTFTTLKIAHPTCVHL